jgi:hypothetical protein
MAWGWAERSAKESYSSSESGYVQICELTGSVDVDVARNEVPELGVGEEVNDGIGGGEQDDSEDEGNDRRDIQRYHAN